MLQVDPSDYYFRLNGSFTRTLTPAKLQRMASLGLADTASTKYTSSCWFFTFLKGPCKKWISATAHPHPRSHSLLHK